MEISHSAAASARYELLSHYGATKGARGQSASSAQKNTITQNGTKKTEEPPKKREIEC